MTLVWPAPITMVSPDWLLIALVLVSQGLKIPVEHSARGSFVHVIEVGV